VTKYCAAGNSKHVRVSAPNKQIAGLKLAAKKKKMGLSSQNFHVKTVRR
jgi:hypothetical protein